MRRLLLIGILLATFPAFGKSLHWRALDVNARLDRDGRLHVVERQAIVFDGDWNGGERTFRIGTKQVLNFDSMARIDEAGVEHPMSNGDLSGVDQWRFVQPEVLRWRSRMPSDAPFANQEITYVLTYSLDNILRHTGDTYVTNHDFAFPERPGVIENFSLKLVMDPVWKGMQSPLIINRRQLVPGEGVVVPMQLEYTGAEAPALTINTLSPMTAYGILFLFALTIAYLFFDFFMAEIPTGRFARVVSPSEVNDRWLEENVFRFPPEVVGAAIDLQTAGAEVAAMLARMTLEGTIASRVETRRNLLFERSVLCLDLKKDKNALKGAEAALVRKLFFSGNSTDTDKIRKHYSGTGFNPASVIKASVEGQLKGMASWSKNPRRANFKQDTIVMVIAFLLLIIAALFGGNNSGVAVFLIMVAVPTTICAAIAASTQSRAITELIPRLALPLIFLVPLFWLVMRYTLRTPDLALSILTPIAACAWAASILKLTLDMLRTPQHPDAIAFRKRLVAARNYFIDELRSAQPRLRDEWYPYFLAFGLGKNVDRWFGAHGAESVGGSSSGFTQSTSSSSFSGSSSSSAPSFSGGGGAFGGAGASGGWAMAAAAMASGVSAPSSSSSSGGGSSSSSSSSSSSGGGGGGGW